MFEKPFALWRPPKLILSPVLFRLLCIMFYVRHHFLNETSYMVDFCVSAHANVLGLLLALEFKTWSELYKSLSPGLWERLSGISKPVLSQNFWRHFPLWYLLKVLNAFLFAKFIIIVAFESYFDRPTWISVDILFFICAAYLRRDLVLCFSHSFTFISKIDNCLKLVYKNI